MYLLVLPSVRGVQPTTILEGNCLCALPSSRGKEKLFLFALKKSLPRVFITSCGNREAKCFWFLSE